MGAALQLHLVQIHEAEQRTLTGEATGEDLRLAVESMMESLQMIRDLRPEMFLLGPELDELKSMIVAALGSADAPALILGTVQRELPALAPRYERFLKEHSEYLRTILAAICFVRGDARGFIDEMPIIKDKAAALVADASASMSGVRPQFRCPDDQLLDMDGLDTFVDVDADQYIKWLETGEGSDPCLGDCA